MRRLTLILSDLYLPAEATRDRPAQGALSLPHLDWLLCFAREREVIGDWRAWLAQVAGAPALAALPPAQVVAQASLGAEMAANTWLATPVRLEARLDHVRLIDRGLVEMSPDERAALMREFAEAFGASFALHDAGARALILTGLSTAGAITVDPARLLDADVGHAVVRGNTPADAREIRRLSSEIEMWLHGAAVNAARERAGKPRISSLWIWGGAPPARLPVRSRMEPAPLAWFGEDPYLAALAQATGAQAQTAPDRFDELAAVPENAVIELAPMSGAAAHTLVNLDAHWFGPARAALAGGTLAELTLVANDVCFRVGPRGGLRFWRRPRGWLEPLRHARDGAQA
jgi:hypothetical protein